MMRVIERPQTPLSVPRKPPSPLNQISPHLNIPFIHMNYGEDPYGSHNVKAREGVRELQVACTRSGLFEQKLG